MVVTGSINMLVVHVMTVISVVTGSFQIVSSIAGSMISALEKS